MTLVVPHSEPLLDFCSFFDLREEDTSAMERDLGDGPRNPNITQELKAAIAFHREMNLVQPRPALRTCQ